LKQAERRVVLLYHYFHPDDVISARLYSDLATHVAARGWNVIAMPANRHCHSGDQDTTQKQRQTLPKRESWGDVTIHRVYRPDLKQSSNKGRVINMLFMLWGWTLRALLLPRTRHEVVVIGTDPVLGILVAIAWRLLRPSSRIVHWCHDVYPEAIIADGMLHDNSILVRLMRWFLRRAYRRCDVIADLGPCMRKLLAQYGSQAPTVTRTPWSLYEPDRPVAPEPATRQSLFGNAQLALLYSGNLGRAHQFETFVALARQLQNDSAHFVFAGRGSRVEELKGLVSEQDRNISFAGFASEADLAKRLGACDIHLVSLRPEWTGTVVPSKFFGALASGRSVLFAGSANSAIAKWIQEYQVGWVLTPDNISQIASTLRSFAQSPEQMQTMQERCFRVYQEHFSQRIQLAFWDQTLEQFALRP
jgi:glycosyltransferase involved in cell wall biosynthesis